MAIGQTVKHKYVRHSQAGFILWPHSDDLFHKHIGDAIRRSHLEGEILSAGFAFIGANTVVCNGESESLGIKSRPDDTAALAAQLGRIARPANAEPAQRPGDHLPGGMAGA